MKQIQILFLFFICASLIYCKRSLKKAKQEPIEVPANLDGTKESYPQSILEEINHYLTQYQYPELSLNPKLTETSKLAAQEILESNNFGQHSQIEKWQSEVPNDIFTEICFIVNVTNSNYYSKSLSSKTSKIMYDTKMSVGTIMKTISAPSAEMFAKNIIEALEAEHLLLTLNQYQGCGISLVALDQTKYPNEYLTVMHLIKPASGAVAQEEKVIYTSCKDALEKGNKDSQITITVNGKEIQVFCDQTSQGGGWTMVHKINKDFTNNATQAIDDLGLEYTQLYFTAEQDHYVQFNPSGWKSKGFNFAFNVFRFGDIWWASEETPYTRNPFETMPNHNKYNIGKQIDRLEPSNYCYFENVNHVGYCCYKFLFKTLPTTGRLNAISDYESVIPFGADDNTHHYDCAIYVR